MSDEQSWETCRHSFPSEGDSGIAYELKQHELFEEYDCCRAEVVQSENYQIYEVSGRDKLPMKVAMLHNIVLAHDGLHLIDDEIARLRQKVEMALSGCGNCRYYEKR